MREFSEYLSETDTPHTFISPFSGKKPALYTLIAARKIFEKIAPPLAVSIYRNGHSKLLTEHLKKKLRTLAECSIYAQCPLSANSALLARRDRSQKVVMVTHFNVSQADEWVGKNMLKANSPQANNIRRFEEELLPKLDGIVFVSEFMRSNLIERIPSIKSIPYKVVPNFIKSPLASDEHLPQLADLLMIGTLESRKNQMYALEVIAASGRRGRPLTITLAGDGPDRSALMQRAAQLNISKFVNFLGFVKNAATLFNQHRACFHAAQMENLPVTLIEALSRGAPIFAPPVGGIPEIFNDGIEGRFISLSNPEEAAETIISWIDNKEIMSNAKRAAQLRFTENFQSDIVAKSLLDFIKDPRC